MGSRRTEAWRPPFSSVNPRRRSFRRSNREPRGRRTPCRRCRRFANPRPTARRSTERNPVPRRPADTRACKPPVAAKNSRPSRAGRRRCQTCSRNRRQRALRSKAPSGPSSHRASQFDGREIAAWIRTTVGPGTARGQGLSSTRRSTASGHDDSDVVMAACSDGVEHGLELGLRLAVVDFDDLGRVIRRLERDR
jgi:hypothetical protein